MADCPYARCIQERKHIRRELLRWTKNMVFVVGLERVAEELMGRRRWKQYQDTLYTGSCSSESPTTTQQQQLQLQLQQQAQNHRLFPAVASAVAHLPRGTQVLSSGQNQVGQVKQEPLPLKANLTNHNHENKADHCQDQTKTQQQQEIESRLKIKSEPPEGSVLPLDATNQQSNRTEATSVTTVNNGSVSNRRRSREDDDEIENENGNEAEAEKRLKPNHENDREVVNPLRENEQSSADPEHVVGTNDTEGTKERKDEIALERIQVIQGLLRVKKEEELQEIPSSGGESTKPPPASGVTNATTNNGENTNSEGSTLLLPKKEIEGSEKLIGQPIASFIVNRRASPPPEDWKPLDKCYFCLDGKLSNDDQPPLSPQSDSSNSSRSAESPMSVQVDPMAASVVAAALSGTYPTLLPQWCLPPREPPHVNVQSHQDNVAGNDQPLDLSAKPKNSQDNNISLLEQQKIPLRVPGNIDPKTIFKMSQTNSTCYRGKPRMTGQTGSGVPVVGIGGSRRTYTEDELQAALRDIQSGKLGTRRAAVLYGIPRSTLRNKVYKLAMERERDASLSSTHSHAHDSTTAASTTTVTATTTTTTTTTTQPNMTQNASVTSPTPKADEMEDKELSGAEDEKEVEKALLKPLLSLEDLVRFSTLEGGGGDSLRTLLQRGQESGAEWPGFEHTNIGPYIQKMLAATVPFKGLDAQDQRIPEVMRRLMSEDKRLSKDANLNGDQSHHPHHHLLQAVQHHQQTYLQSQQRGPMTNDDFNPSIEEEASDSGQGRAILKIPSYKPANTPGSSKNGEPNSAAFVQSFAAAAAAASAAAGSPGLLERASPAFSGTSSPTNSLVGKGMGVNFRDVIAKSISHKFQEGQSSTGLPGQGTQTAQAMGNEANPFKRGRYTPPQSQQQSSTQQQTNKPQQSQENKPKPGTGGKGTRPKRGKYRNYDRDSLVEAVRAVQRGEMSVHRAGSYYGVPHSTLEYKVKERHLMRPRKRDQKPPDDKVKEVAGASTVGMRASTPDKKPQMKPQKPFTPPGGIPGPNGLKMPPFIEGMPHLPFAHPFNFWGPTPFMPSPFIPGGPNVPGMLPEQYFATQRMRGLQEQQRNAIAQQQQQHQRDRDGNTPSSEPGTSNSRGSSIAKSTREIAESLYDGTGANGSFLDNLIRSSLETGISRDQRAIADARNQQQHPEALSSKALIDQLCRNSRRTPLPRMTQDSSEDESYRAPSSNRSLPDRPERVPTVDLSPSPSEKGRPDDGSDRLTSPPTPLSLSRVGSRDEDTRDSRSSREREVQNGGSQPEDREKKTPTQPNHYPDIHNLYAVSTDKKSACDSKLIVDHSSQKTQQQLQQQHKEYAAVGGLVVQLQRGYNSGNNRSGVEQLARVSPTNPQPQEHSGATTVLSMEDSVEQ